MDSLHQTKTWWRNLIIVIHYLLPFHPHYCNTKVTKHCEVEITSLSVHNHSPLRQEQTLQLMSTPWPVLPSRRQVEAEKRPPPSPSAPPVDGTNCPRSNHLYLLFEQWVFSSGNTRGWVETLKSYQDLNGALTVWFRGDYFQRKEISYMNTRWKLWPGIVCLTFHLNSKGRNFYVAMNSCSHWHEKD